MLRHISEESALEGTSQRTRYLAHVRWHLNDIDIAVRGMAPPARLPARRLSMALPRSAAVAASVISAAA